MSGAFIATESGLALATENNNLLVTEDFRATGGIPHRRRTMLHYRAPENPQETLATPENVPVLNWRKAKRLQRHISKVAPLHPPMAISNDGEEAMILLLAA